MARRLAISLGSVALLAAIPMSAAASFGVPGAHLLPPNTAGPGAYGASVAVSADGNTALIGGDRVGSLGAVEVAARSGSTWAKQAELTPADLATNAGFGSAVALSADGDTALVGDMGTPAVGECDTAGTCSSGSGLPSAVWVFVRSGSTWTQQGRALSPSDARGASGFGSSVALSADGDTALVGAHLEGHTGAAYVFTRSGASWSRGVKLSAGDEVGRGSFGWSVALSWDGNTALIGSPSDSEATDELGNLTDVGAAWVFTRAGSGWKQQGGKLTGPGGVVPEFGRAVALSADGRTALITGDMDSGFPTFAGAVWTFVRSGSAWKEKGPKLVLNDPTLTTSGFGVSLAMSAGGDTALIGAVAGGYRYVWEFARTATGWKQGPRLSRFGGLNFGQTMAVTPAGDTAFIGTNDGVGPGSVWVFRGAASPSASRPSVSQIAPASGRSADQVTISGTNLTGTAVVQIGESVARFTVVAPTRIRATVPASATTGKVTVSTPHGTATSAKSFTVTG